MQPLVASVSTGACRGRGLIPTPPERHSGPVCAAVVPGSFNQQPPYVSVTGLGDRALHAAGTGGILAGNQTQIGADAPATEAFPVADLDRQRESGQRRDAAKTCQPSRYRAKFALRSQRDDLLVETGTPRGGQHHRLVGILKRRLRGSGVEPLVVQPPVVALSPRFAVVVEP